jgi:hypothetical protein
VATKSSRPRGRTSRQGTAFTGGRPRTVIELLYEVLRAVERTRGSPREAEQVKRLVIQPLQQILVCATVIVVVIGTIIVAALLSGKKLDLGPTVGKVGSEWVVSGSAVLTFIWALVYGRIRAWRRGRTPGFSTVPQQRSPEGAPSEIESPRGETTEGAVLEPAPDKQGATG